MSYCNPPQNFMTEQKGPIVYWLQQMYPKRIRLADATHPNALCARCECVDTRSFSLHALIILTRHLCNAIVNFRLIQLLVVRSYELGI